MSQQTIQAAQIRTSARRIVAGSMQAGRVIERSHAQGFPYGREWPFGLTFVGADLIVWSGVLYHGDREVVWAGPDDPDDPEPQVTGLTDGQIVFIRYAMAPAFSTPAVDFVALADHERQTGYILRRLVTVTVAGGVARQTKWWGGGLNLGLMGDRP